MNSVFLRLVPATVAITLLASAAPAQSFEFSIRNMMRGPEVYGRTPSQVRWTADGQWIYFNWNDRVRPVAGSQPQQVTQAHMDSVAPLLAAGALSGDRRMRAVEARGDIYVVDLARGTARRLTDTQASETSPTFSADSREVFFVRDNNVFSIRLSDGLTRQHTDVRSGPAPKDSAKAEGQRATLRDQQRELLGAIRDRIYLDSLEKAEEEERKNRRVKPMYLDKGERISRLSVSPGGGALLITTAIPNERAVITKVPNYVTETGYTEELNTRTKVGDFQSGGRIAFMSLPDGKVQFLKLARDTTKQLLFASVQGWNQQGTSALVYSTSGDFKERYIHSISASGDARLLDTLRDTAWVAGPCSSCGGWYDGGRRVWFVSEADGFAHLYTMAADGSDRRQLTKGNWEVLDVQLSSDQSRFYLTTNETTPFEQHVFRMPVSGGTRERLTTRTGSHDVTLSPDERMMADIHSTANRPPELFVGPASPNAPLAQLTTSPTKEWLSFNWITPEIVMIPASDGVRVPARIYRPRDMNAQPNGAGVIFVHGAGYLHNVHNYWSTYAREYMFNQYLASKGYVVLDIDYRASAGYGRDWRTAIYRWMGGRDLQDHVDGSRYLQREFGIHPERVGIYGGSYGGFITLMALFTEPKSFGAGAALRSVTDWAHYNHVYTGRILNLPQADSVAYRRSSPIYFADGLEDPLVMLHGMVDVNVHFSDVVRLSQRLIELGKTDWELAVYPVEDHAFVRPDSWTDEYRRIFELFERAIRPERR
jgi:dipeptidyl aminopeptidase/acylaminoacyl peptidase